MYGKLIQAGSIRNESRYLIRGYHRSDRNRIRHICSETGFLGNPQESFFIGRQIFADIFSRYYTDFEPQSALVAVVDRLVEGYLLGCLDTRKQKKIFSRRIMPGIALRMLDPRWLQHSINRQFNRATRRSRSRGEFDFPDEQTLDHYPAHLHINIGNPALRGMGVGRKLIFSYLSILRSTGVQGVHLCTTSHNRSAVMFYERMGFYILHKSRITCYDHVVEDLPVYMICYGMKL